MINLTFVFISLSIGCEPQTSKIYACWVQILFIIIILEFSLTFKKKLTFSWTLKNDFYEHKHNSVILKLHNFLVWIPYYNFPFLIHIKQSVFSSTIASNLPFYSNNLNFSQTFHLIWFCVFFSPHLHFILLNISFSLALFTHFIHSLSHD